MVGCQIDYQGYSRHQFYFGGYHAGGIWLGLTEDLDAGNVYDALKDAEHSHSYGEDHDTISKEERYERIDEKEYSCDKTAAQFDLLVDLHLEYVFGNEVQESSGIVTFLPFVENVNER